MASPFRHSILAGTLSFLMPGLGQLHQSRVRWACLFFTGFILILAFAPVRLWILVPMAVSAWDAQRHSLEHPIVWNFRTGLFLAVATVGFFSAFSLLIDYALPSSAEVKLSYLADSLAEPVKRCLEKHPVKEGTLASLSSSCPELASVWKNDPWGTPFHLWIHEDKFEIISFGRDRQTQSSDDFVFRYRWRGMK